MFDFSAWLTQSLIDGTQKGLFAREFAAIKVADYMLKGVLSPEQAEHIALETVPPPVVEEPLLDLETGLPIEPVEEPIPVEDV